MEYHGVRYFGGGEWADLNYLHDGSISQFFITILILSMFFSGSRWLKSPLKCGMKDLCSRSTESIA
jgi:hypothetical protein